MQPKLIPMSAIKKNGLLSLAIKFTLLKAMHNLPRLDSAFWATGRFLSEIAAKIGDMCKVEVGTADGAMSVFR